MARPSKPVSVIEAEKKSHRTKAELDFRREQEAGLLTGSPMKESPEVKKDPAAHKEFIRVRNLMKKIGRNDALYEGVINRYAKLKSEVARLEELISQERELKSLFQLEGLLQQKRKFLFDIEKEACMTVAASLRAIPKTPPKEDDDDPLRNLLE